MTELGTEFLFDMTADLERGHDLPATPLGRRVVFYVKGGTFEGPKIKGEVLPGGGDWALFGTDGAEKLDVRLVLRTDDGELIYMTYRGIAYGLGGPEAYFRTVPFFETGSEKYDWLNRIVSVGVGRVTQSGVGYAVYAVR